MIILDFQQLADDDGWITIQRRIDNSVDFYLTWDDYVQEFGTEDGNFWLGLDRIHCLTSRGQTELHISVVSASGATAHIVYDSFHITDSSNKYVLSIGDYSGPAGNSLGYSNGAPFSTRDQDNSQEQQGCGISRGGAWWYKYCTYSNLNGIYLVPGTIDSSAIQWHAFATNAGLRRCEMKVRRI